MNKLKAKIFFVMVALSLGLMSSFASAQSLDALANTAQTWLKKLDANDVQGAWNDTAPSMRATSKLTDFAKTLSEKRTPLGAVKGRGFTALEVIPSKQKEDAPQIAVTFQVGFENKVTFETTVLQQQPNGQWLVTAYLLR